MKADIQEKNTKIKRLSIENEKNYERNVITSSFIPSAVPMDQRQPQTEITSRIPHDSLKYA